MLFSLLNSAKARLQVMEGFLSAANFQSFAGTPIVNSRYNAPGDRIGTIRAAYFEKLFERIATLYTKQIANLKFELDLENDIVKNIVPFAAVTPQKPRTCGIPP